MGEEEKGSKVHEILPENLSKYLVYMLKNWKFCYKEDYIENNEIFTLFFAIRQEIVFAWL